MTVPRGGKLVGRGRGVRQMMTFVDWLFTLSIGWLSFVLTLTTTGFALVGKFIVRRWVLPRLKLEYEDAYYAAALVQSAMLLWGLIAALTAVGVWQRYTQVSDVVSSEATAIASLWRDLGGYPEPLRGESREILKGYTVQIIERAWPQMQQGIVPREGVEWMDRLQEKLFAFEPATTGQQLMHAEALRSFNHLVVERRQRLDSIEGGIPDVLWLVLLPGALLCLAMCLFFQVRNAKYQATLLVGVSVFISMVLFVIVALDRPFMGERGITSHSYQLIYDHHMVER